MPALPKFRANATCQSVKPSVYVFGKMIAEDKTLTQPDWLQQRIKHWESLYDKYEKRGSMNLTDSAFSEVNYRFFAKSVKRKPSRRKAKRERVSKLPKQNTKTDKNFNKTGQIETSLNDIDVSTIIDGNSDETLIVGLKTTPVRRSKASEINHSLFNHNCAYSAANGEVISFIEKDLDSPLRELLVKRSESKILENNDYNQWHYYTKREMRRLEKYITKDELKEYLRYCNSTNVNISELQAVIKDMCSNINILLVKREFMRHNTVKYSKYCMQIHMEWQRLTKRISVDCMVLYASNVIASIVEGKKLFSTSRDHISEKYLLEKNNASDSGIIM